MHNLQLPIPNFFLMILHHLPFLLLFFPFHFHGILCNVSSLNKDTDRDALLSFKSHVTDPKNALSGWTSNSSHCTWHGVSCSKVGSRVQSLSLRGLGLSGELPSHLSNLTYLHSLDLSDNAFRGQIPLEFSRLSLLNEIAFASNNLDGTLPAQLTHLHQLHILDFSANNLTGEIPPEFGNLSSLTNLSLARNQLSGEIPSELGNLRNLSYLQLSENYFSGEFPISIFNISSLVFLSVTKNRLSGKLPQYIGQALPNLRSLYLANNRFWGVIPSSISNASRLEFFDLSHNEFHGFVPLFRNMKNLTQLIIGDNYISSTTSLNSELFDSLRNCTKLKILMIQSNQLAGDLPKSVANLSTNLEQFCVSNNSFTGRIPQGMGKFQNLVSLSFEMNHFTGEIPLEIGALNKLVRFLVYENSLSGEIPDVFGNFTQLFILAMGFNKLSGRIPSSIGQCKRLNFLDLQKNNLHGTIPEEIFRLSGLTTLSLSGNALYGSLPSELNSMEQLQIVYISDNRLSGYIPEEIDGCASLQSLVLARNNFSGSIPSTMGNLTSLETLDLSSNNLSGSIPATLEKLQYMVKLNFSFNHLEGEVPTKGVFMNLSEVALLGNKNLCSHNKEIAEKLGISLCVPAKKNRVPTILAVTGATVLFISMFCLGWASISRMKKNKGERKSLSSARLKGLPQNISYADIRAATNNFASENLIGKGSFGFVYKGVFRTSPGETTLAVKVLDLQQSEASRSFNAECEALKNVRHRNLVKLITSCCSIDHKGDDFKALIMQFMSNGNLDTWLYPIVEESESSLNFSQRLNIAIDIASAMDYLHYDCDPAVVHCDLKPGNVLLDENMVAHVGDFGLARLLSQNSSETTTVGLKGTIGYIAPEYGQGGKASTSGDVYSFGILLLEMFIAKKPTDKMFKEGLSLNKFASAMDENQILKVADPNLFNVFEYSLQSSSTGYPSDGNSSDSNNYSNTCCPRKTEEYIAAVIKVGLCCAAELAKDRLTMREASKKLQGIREAFLAL